MRTFILSIASLVVLTASAASASTITLSPTTLAVEKGQSFNIVLTADAGSLKLYTIKAAVSYPADILEATGFTFGSGWLQLSQSGYDNMTPGSIIKTAGFTGGFTAQKTFGTIAFRAKESGTATISVVSASSVAYDAQSKNTLTGSQGSASITVAAPAPKPAPAAATPSQGTSAPATGSVAGAAATKKTQKPAEEVVTVVATSVEATSTEGQAAAAGFLAGNWLYAILAIVVAILLGVGLTWYVRSR